jgi:hypothetical protein
MNIILNIPKKHPFVFGVGITALKTGGMDVIVQTMVEGKKISDIDTRRMWTFLLFGALFNGVWQYALFVKMMPRIVPGAFAFARKPLREKIKDKEGIKGVLLQNFVENGINNPVLYFPCFYTTKALLDGRDIKDGIRLYKKNWKEDVLAIWSVWVPAQAFNFAFSPPHFRVPFVAVVSALWTALVSIRRGQA